LKLSNAIRRLIRGGTDFFRAQRPGLGRGLKTWISLGLISLGAGVIWFCHDDS
jgi:hypothetical protein